MWQEMMQAVTNESILNCKYQKKQDIILQARILQEKEMVQTEDYQDMW